MQVKFMLVSDTVLTFICVVNAAIVAWSRLKLRFLIFLGS